MVRCGGLILASLSAATMAVAQTAPTPSGRQERQDWQQECSAQADRDNLSGTHRDAFMLECVAGEKLSQPPQEKPAAPR
ncbi:PsiF family protein [Methylobacterium nigriterrae]|uniref:PsiF family protein n=1 Tax=Methylobacterium nigriterrae TaxID=3127512 RepID=UPI003D6776C6